jgi:hypothetical protein
VEKRSIFTRRGNSAGSTMQTRPLTSRSASDRKTPQESAFASVTTLSAANRFTRIAQQLAGVVLSMSPNTLFPVPHILDRLRHEEEKQGGYQPLPAAVRQSVESDVSGVESTVSVWSAMSTKFGVSIEAKRGLGYLITNNNTLAGVFRHQMLCVHEMHRVKRSIDKTVCVEMDERLFPYYSHAPPDAMYQDVYDIRLGDYIKFMCNRVQETCDVCTRTLMDHEIVYTHANVQVAVDVAPAAIELDTTAILVRCRCIQCGACTRYAQLSFLSSLYSFGKYLEQLVYNAHLIPASLCEHSSDCTNVAMDYYWNGTQVQFLRTKNIPYEIRLSKIQLISNLVILYQNQSRLAIQEPDELALRPAITKEWTTSLRRDVMQFYQSAKQRVDFLEDQVMQHVNTESLENAVLMAMLKEMHLQIKNEENGLNSMLALMDIRKINDVRRKFRDRLVGTRLLVDLWEKGYAPQVNTITPDWLVPEWMEPTVGRTHIFPNSWVIVRESEITSIVAFALTSDEYISSLRDMGARPQEDQYDDPDDEVAQIFESMHHEEMEIMERGVSDSFFTFSQYTDEESADRLVLHGIPPLVNADDFMSMNTDESSFDTDGSLNELQANILWLRQQEDGERRTSQEVTMDREAMPTSYRVAPAPFQVEMHYIGYEQGPSPHLLYAFSEGSTRFSCTIYYAAEFEMLRRKCGIQAGYVHSLERCFQWDNFVGRDRSMFYKTQDDKYLIKQLISQDSSAFDHDHLLAFLPAYFDYVDIGVHVPPYLLG